MWTLAELMRWCSSIQDLISRVFKQKGKKKEKKRDKSWSRVQIYTIYAGLSSGPAQRPSSSFLLIRADVRIHDQAIHPLLGHKCIDLCTTDVKASERRAAASVLSLSSNKFHISFVFQIFSKFNAIQIGPPDYTFGGGNLSIIEYYLHKIALR